ncbi:aldo/keto reductase [Fontivita pretiosa]|uniref:aldo/keto reductase n=1 Tax=Fontivita pretiosa TaxID=2989684 RepID=UPI003D16371C
MIYRRFGRTNLSMPVFSCGGMRYQYKWQDLPLSQVPPENQANLEATIRRAIDLGINHIETARGYGSSERQLGLILPRLPRQSLIVQTKIAPSENPDEFTRNFEDSLSRLGLDYVDLLAIHGINNAQLVEQSLRPGGCLAAARRLQRRGLVRHVGFSTHAPLNDILTCIRHEADGGFDYVNLHWYYIFQRNWPAIEEATRRDMGVFIISPSDKGGKLYDPPGKLVELTRPLHPIVFNDLFCLSRPQVHTLSIGAARPTDFDLHLQAMELLPRADQILEPILQRLRDAYDNAVEPDLRDPFNMDLPPWESTPGQINLPIILWLRNLVAAYDMTGYAKMRYNLLGNGGHWFPGRNAAEIDEPAMRQALSHLPQAGRIVAILRELHALIGGDAVKRISQSESPE